MMEIKISLTWLTLQYNTVCYLIFLILCSHVEFSVVFSHSVQLRYQKLKSICKF